MSKTTFELKDRAIMKGAMGYIRMVANAQVYQGTTRRDVQQRRRPQRRGERLEELDIPLGAVAERPDSDLVHVAPVAAVAIRRRGVAEAVLGSGDLVGESGCGRGDQRRGATVRGGRPGDRRRRWQWRRRRLWRRGGL